MGVAFYLGPEAHLWALRPSFPWPQCGAYSYLPTSNYIEYGAGWFENSGFFHSSNRRPGKMESVSWKYSKLWAFYPESSVLTGVSCEAGQRRRQDRRSKWPEQRCEEVTGQAMLGKATDQSASGWRCLGNSRRGGRGWHFRLVIESFKYNLRHFLLLCFCLVFVFYIAWIQVSNPSSITDKLCNLGHVAPHL